MKLHQFDPVLYPIKVWITRDAEESALEESFKDVKGLFSSSLNREDNIATVYSKVLTHTETNKYGFLVVIHPEKVLSVKEIAHEATHVARFIWDYIGEGATGIEADAYLVGWIAQCIEEINKENG